MDLDRDVTVVIDAMGGDNAPSEILAGVKLALDHTPGIRIMLVGLAEIVDPFAAECGASVVAVHATEVIAMDEHPASAVRTKKDSSIVVGARLVAEGQADAFFSAGSTGAAMTAATLIMGRVAGVMRPAIATHIAMMGQPCVLLDVGANADCKPEHLEQFAHMGAAYAEAVMDIAEPRVGLLNIGEEETKGSLLAQAAHELMKEHVPGFVGNVEGRDLFTGVADVVVTDGFTGNVTLKLIEGTSKVLLGEVKRAVASVPGSETCGDVMKAAFGKLVAKMDPESYGGAPLLGLNGVCIIGHGSSSARAVASAVDVSVRAVRGRLTERVAEKVSSAR